MDVTALYDIIHRRRDVRGQFTGDAVDDRVLDRVLSAAHAAPSVGLSQPWDFVTISERSVKEAFARHVREERDVFTATLEVERGAVFERIKIEGVLESSLSVVVTYDAARGTVGAWPSRYRRRRVVLGVSGDREPVAGGHRGRVGRRVGVICPGGVLAGFAGDPGRRPPGGVVVCRSDHPILPRPLTWKYTGGGVGDRWERCCTGNAGNALGRGDGGTRVARPGTWLKCKCPKWNPVQRLVGGPGYRHAARGQLSCSTSSNSNRVRSSYSFSSDWLNPLRRRLIVRRLWE
jgi:nitroreductase